ncbi:MAG TPA: M15 family metallopeptidase [Gaiellaceae bacterium]|nr:M15 family metallopeptidase [Gaiellaceae bacterium]
MPVALLALVAALVPQVWHASSRPLTAADRTMVRAAGEYHAGCPVPLRHLRVLAVRHYGFDGKVHTGQLIVNADDVAKLKKVFRGLYKLRFPIRHMRLSDTYGSVSAAPADGDISASFECRQAAASPCTGVANQRTGTWSEHAYGQAIDLNPVENPYVGCGMTRDKTALSYLDRSRHRRGMVTPAVVRLFASVGWGWGGSWAGSTKDYMHFSATGH